MRYWLIASRWRLSPELFVVISTPPPFNFALQLMRTNMWPRGHKDGMAGQANQPLRTGQAARTLKHRGRRRGRRRDRRSKSQPNFASSRSVFSTQSSQNAHFAVISTILWSQRQTVVEKSRKRQSTSYCPSIWPRHLSLLSLILFSLFLHVIRQPQVEQTRL